MMERSLTFKQFRGLEAMDSRVKFDSQTEATAVVQHLCGGRAKLRPEKIKKIKRKSPFYLTSIKISCALLCLQMKIGNMTM